MQLSDLYFWHDSDRKLARMYLTFHQARGEATQEDIFGNMPRPNILIQLNGNIHIKCVILKLIASSTAEAKFGALSVNTK